MLSTCLARLCVEPQAKLSLLTALPVSPLLLKPYFVPLLQLLTDHLEDKSILPDFFQKVVRSRSGRYTSPCAHSISTVGEFGEVDAYNTKNLSECTDTLRQRETQVWEARRSFNTSTMFPFQPHASRNGIFQQPPVQWLNMNPMNGMNQQQMFMQQNMLRPMYQVMPMQNQVMFKGNRPRGPQPGNMGPRAWSPSTPGRNQFPQQQQQYPQHNNRPRNNKRKSSECAFDEKHPSPKMGRYQGESFQQLNSSRSNLNMSNSTAMYMSVVNGAKPIYHVPGQSSCERITEAIVEYYNSSHQSEEDLRHKIVLSNCLYAIVRDIFPGCRLFIVGSSLSGFGTHTSDMDLCLLVTQIQQIDQKYEAVHILNAIHKSLKDCTFIKSSQVIKAKVPILKFTDSMKNIECDLNINNGVGIRNTHLLKYYCLADNRVAPLMLFIKFWARFHNINDAHKRTISSYSLALMLIHYLQVCSPPVLPCLQMEFPDRFGSTVDLRNLRLDEPLHHKPSQNRDSLGQLFQGFLDYYTFTFRPEFEVISIRRGCVLDKMMVQRNSKDPHQWKCLCVEEPFDYSNTARSVFDPNIFVRVQQVFRRSAQELKKEGDVFCILQQPF
ncbi:poly(A) RNA polymerase GLD2-like isoform X2 [Babylonia areolata]|uniref:poly(A) RNA polymerase GLD2-like isoform X2 n=1 Tax=Babylonia areolata TaxID=304850 RepID=UPI003FD51EF4